MRSIFKLTDHSNKFFLSPRHYKYNLQREYSRSCTALTIPPVRVSPCSLFLFLFFSFHLLILIAARRKNWNLRGESRLPRWSRFSSIFIRCQLSSRRRTNKHRESLRFFTTSFPSRGNAFSSRVRRHRRISINRTAIATLFPSDDKRTTRRSRRRSRREFRIFPRSFARKRETFP